jgi:hypothetical protein
MRNSSVPALLALFAVSACTGSPSTLAMQPDFEVATSAGPAAVSIRGAPPGMTQSEFEQVVRTGMAAEIPASHATDPAAAPDRERRIVWHLDPVPARGASRLVVNAFDGSVPYAYREAVVDDSAPAASVGRAVRSMTHQLASAPDRQGQPARG